jgi:hypothetical protein
MNRPFTCTASGLPFQSFQNWREHRATIRSWEMHRHEEHTRRCLSPREWAMMVLAETMGMQETSSEHRDIVLDAHLCVLAGKE